MDNPQATLTTEDLAWLGGVIDGEGCIALNRRVRGNAVNYHPQIVISNTDPFMIEECGRILRLAGIGHWVMWRKREGDRNRRMMGHVAISGYRRCQKALGTLTSRVRGKRDQAELLLEFIERRLAIGHTKHKTYGATDEQYFLRIRELKRKEAPETLRGGSRWVSEPDDGKI